MSADEQPELHPAVVGEFVCDELGVGSMDELGEFVLAIHDAGVFDENTSTTRRDVEAIGAFVAARFSIRSRAEYQAWRDRLVAAGVLVALPDGDFAPAAFVRLVEATGQ